MHGAVIINYYIIIAVQVLFREKLQPNNRTDIVIVVVEFRGYKKQEIEHQFVLCLNTELKTIFKMDKINRKSLEWSVIY